MLDRGEHGVVISVQNKMKIFARNKPNTRVEHIIHACISRLVVKLIG